MTNNPFPYSDDNKRYHTWNYDLKHRFGQKVMKVSLDAGFSCPNRDGTRAIGGCTFCSMQGSGDTVPHVSSVLEQYHEGRKRIIKKHPDALFITYFQAFTNTHGPIAKIKDNVSLFLDSEEVAAISLATRADCLSPEILDYLSACTDKKEIWLELGLQTIHEDTAQRVNRAHTLDEFINAMNQLKKTPIKTCVHIMNSLPNESETMMKETAKFVSSIQPDAVKIHMLHLLKNTKLAQEYLTNPFPLLSMEDYVNLVVEQLELLDEKIIIQRLTGDALKDELIAPAWTLNKVQVLNSIDKEMARRNSWQGKNK